MRRPLRPEQLRSILSQPSFRTFIIFIPITKFVKIREFFPQTYNTYYAYGTTVVTAVNVT